MVHEGGNFKKLRRNLHAAVDRIDVTENRTRENDEPPAVVGGVVLQVGLQTGPEFQSLIELGCLRGRVCVVERVWIGLGSFLRCVAPYG